MNREVHVRIWERPEVRVLRATRQEPFFESPEANDPFGSTAVYPRLARERQRWVDGGPSCIVRRSAAVGGEPTFAEVKVSGNK